MPHACKCEQELLYLQVFGSGGRLSPPGKTDSVLKYFTNCTARAHPVNAHVKSIVQTQYTLGSGENPHAFRFQDDRHAVASDFSQVCVRHCREQ